MRSVKQGSLAVLLAGLTSAVPFGSGHGRANAEAGPGEKPAPAFAAPTGGNNKANPLGQPPIPAFRPYEYKPMIRDPFLDPSVQVTLLEVKKPETVNTPKPIQDYLEELASLARVQYVIQGIAYDPAAPMALMGGRPCSVGDKITLKLGGDKLQAGLNPPQVGNVPAAGSAAEKSLSDRLCASSRFYGLGLENDLRVGQLRLTVKRITANAVYLGIPRCDRDLVLMYEKNFNLDTDTYASTYAPAVKAQTRTPGRSTGTASPVSTRPLSNGRK